MIEESEKINVFRVESKEDIVELLHLINPSIRHSVYESAFSMLAFSKNTDWKDYSVYLEIDEENITIEMKVKQTFTKKEGIWTM